MNEKMAEWVATPPDLDSSGLLVVAAAADVCAFGFYFDRRAGEERSRALLGSCLVEVRNFLQQYVELAEVLRQSFADSGHFFLHQFVGYLVIPAHHRAVSAFQAAVEACQRVQPGSAGI